MPLEHHSSKINETDDDKLVELKKEAKSLGSRSVEDWCDEDKNLDHNFIVAHDMLVTGIEVVSGM